MFPLRLPSPCYVYTNRTPFLPKDSACWERNLPVSTEAALTSVLSSAGHDAPSILKAASNPRIKDILRANNAEAVALGICGVPSYRVLEKTGSDWAATGSLVWGQDELPVVQDLIAGWKEEGWRGVANVSAAHQDREKRMKSVL